MRRSLGILVLLPALLALPALVAEARESDRAVEVLRYGCANEIGNREVTLFLNGTVRLIDGPPGSELLGLAELSPEELESALYRLRSEDLADARRLMSSGVTGPYIEQCELVLQLPDRKKEELRFGRYDTLPLSLSRIQAVALDLSAKVDDLRGVEELPPGYEPRIGDILKRRDGQKYRIVRFTPMNKGVELQGLDQPLVIFVVREEMFREFVALLSRHP